MAKISTVKIAAENSQGYKIINADDERASFDLSPTTDREPDADPTRAELEEMSREGLVEFLKSKELQATGKNEELLARALEYLDDNESEE